MSRPKQSAEVTRETRLMKALSHPLRWRILDALAAGPASPSTIAAALGEPLGNVSYHVKILVSYDAIELVETRPVRGALEHLYRASGFGEGTHISRTQLELDLRAKEELSDLLGHVVERAQELRAQSTRRAAKTAAGSKLQRTELTILHYDRNGE